MRPRSQLTAAGLVYEKELLPELAYIFEHAVIRDVSYRCILDKRRRDLHRHLAGHIEELYATRLDDWWEVLGHPWERATECQKAMRCYERASAKARERVTDDVSAHFAHEEEQMAEALLDAPVETRVSWRCMCLLHTLGFVAFAALIVLVDRLGPSGRAWGQTLSTATLASGALLSFSLVWFWIIASVEAAHQRYVQHRFVVYPDRLVACFRGGSVDIPFEELVDVKLAAFRLYARGGPSFGLGGSFAGRTVYVSREPRERRGFWRAHGLSLGFFAVFIASVALALTLAGRLFPPPPTSFSSARDVILFFALGTGLLVLGACVPLGLLYLVIRPRLARLLEEELRGARLLSISAADPQAFYASLSAALEKFRRERAAPAESPAH